MGMNFRNSRQFAAAASFIAAFLCCAASAQVTTAIHGVVQDSSGALVPKADLKLLDTSTKTVQNTISTDAGSFVFTNLPGGTFEITVTAAGFRATTLSNI